MSKIRMTVSDVEITRSTLIEIADLEATIAIEGYSPAAFAMAAACDTVIRGLQFWLDEATDKESRP